MLRYALPILLLSASICQGQSVEEIWLDDRDVHYISHKHLGTGIGIAKSFLDTLLSCHAIFPNGVMYEVYPKNSAPPTHVTALSSASPFTGCGISFRGVGVEYSGTYELLSFVERYSDKSRTLTRRRFNLKVTLPDFS